MKKFELGSIRDLIFLVSNSQLGIVQHTKNNVGEDMYFLIGGTFAETFIYYVKCEEIKKKFIIFDISKDKVEYSDLPTINARIKVIPIIEVKNQDIFNSN